MNGLHKHLRDDYTSPVVLGELRGGTLKDGTSSLGTSLDRATIVTNALTTTSTGITNWNGYYSKLLQLNHFILEVENGCTLPEDLDPERLFDRFYRVDTTRSRTTGGSGIGLSVARAIVEHHGGTLTAARHGCSICFRARFPQ